MMKTMFVQMVAAAALASCDEADTAKLSSETFHMVTNQKTPSETGKLPTKPPGQSVALKIALVTIKQLKPDSTPVLKSQTVNSLPWSKAFNDVFLKDTKTEPWILIKQQIATHRYEAFYFSSKAAAKGGDATIFIDIQTGQVLATLLGK